MSRVAKAPVAIPAGVEVKLNGQEITIKGAKGELTRVFHNGVVIAQEDNQLTFGPREGVAMHGHKQVLHVLLLRIWLLVLLKALLRNSF